MRCEGEVDMNHFKLLGIVVSLMLSSSVYADDFLQRYEGDVLPIDPAADLKTKLAIVFKFVATEI